MKQTARTCVITGGNGGIGQAMAEALASAGHRIIIWGRSAEKNRRAVTALEKKGVLAMSQLCDVSDKNSVDKAFAEAVERNGAIHGLFANAAVNGSRLPFVERSREEWDRTLATNVMGVVFCFQAAVRHMIGRANGGQPFGRLVATSSFASLTGAANNESYAATKAAVNALVRALAVELARYGITANSILPGYVETEMSAPIFSNPKFQENVLPRVPMRRFGQPDDYGAIAQYLMSDGSAYHTGQSFLIDGGYSLY